MGTIASIGVKPVGWKELMRATVAALVEMVPRRPKTQLSVQKSVAVGQKASATLVVVNGEQFLLGVTSNSVSLLRKWTTATADLEIRGFVR